MTEFTHTPGKKNNIRKWLIPVIIIVVVAIIVAVVLMVVNKKETPTQANKGPSAVKLDGYTVNYPSNWRSLKRSEAEMKNGVALKLVKRGESASYVMRVVEGELDKNFAIASLPDEVAASLEKGVKGFSLVHKKVTKIGEFDAAQVQYKQKSGKTTYENRMSIIPRQKHSYYLTLSAKDGNISNYDSDAQKITDSLVGYISNHP